MLAGALLLNWLLAIPFVAAAVCAAYPRVRGSDHQPTGALAAAQGVPLLVALIAAFALVLGRPAALPLQADYRWTPDTFQFRLQFGVLEAAFILVLCWQFLATATGLHLAARLSPQPSLSAASRQAAAISLAAGCLIGALVSRDAVTTLFFWQAAALPAAWLVMFGGSTAARPRMRPGAAFLAVHFAGAFCMLASYALVWAQTGATDPVAAGASLLSRGSGPERIASMLLFVGFAAGILGAAALSVIPGLGALASMFIAAGCFTLLRSWHLLFSPYVLGISSPPLLWLCALAGCAAAGASLAAERPRAGAGLVAAALAVFSLAAVAASGAGTRAAPAAAAFTLAVGVALPLLAALSHSLSGQSADERRKSTLRPPAVAWLAVAAVLLLVLPVPGLAGWHALAILIATLWHHQIGPALVLSIGCAVAAAGGIAAVVRGRWAAASRGGWPAAMVAALAAAAIAVAVAAAAWAPVVAQQVLLLTREGG